MGLLVGAAGAIMLLVAPFVETGITKPVQEAVSIAMSSFGGALLGIAVSNIWWTEVTKEETNAALREAVADTFTQDPEFVAQYFREDMILGFLKNNVQSQIGSDTLAQAVTTDLLGPFLSKEGSGRVRSFMNYSVSLSYCEPGTGAAVGSASGAWTVLEDLCFDGQLPTGLGAESIIAAFVFTESELAQYFEAEDCLYRSIAYMPADLKDAEARTAWSKANLACSLRLGDVEIELEPEFSVAGEASDERRVTFTLSPSAVLVVEEIVSSARASLGGPRAEVRVTLNGRLTLAPSAHSFPAYLVYPTLSPEIEFKIDGPVHHVECSTFYNTASRSDVRVDHLDGSAGGKHLKVRLASKRWVFPVSGASFSWTDCE